MVEEQCQEIEQEHRPEWFKPCCPCGVFCANLFLSGVLLVQDIQMMKDDLRTVLRLPNIFLLTEDNSWNAQLLVSL